MNRFVTVRAIDSPHVGSVKVKVLACLTAVAIGLVAFAIVNFRAKTRVSENADPQLDSSSQKAILDARLSPQSDVPKDWIAVGGIKRPPTDVVKSEPRVSSKSNIRSPVPLKPEGFPAPIDSATNSQTRAVADALVSGTNPERYSSFIVPESFDPEAFKANPESYAKGYAETVEPGRVYASAQPEDGVPVIRASSDRMHRVVQGESVELAVEADSFAPVTFTSQQLGSFPNGLSSITVVADANGKASVAFTASGGTKDNVFILAASPVTSGQVRFVVNVSLVNKS
jgi:hypothetical protein